MRRPKLHVVALAHLDTQWRWTARDSARDHLPATVAENEVRFDDHPSYVLSFEGAWRYRLLAEHHPERFARVRRRVAEGRWFPAGAAVEAFDAILPAPESILRQILLGREWFRRELGCDSRDLFLPDCFGFPVTLPTLAVHAGIVGFSTQKLRRGSLMRSASGIPFAYGRWRGADGSELLAALDPGEYSGKIEGDLANDPVWIERFRRLAAAGGGDRLLLYVGTGDRGGAPPENTIARLEAALRADGAIDVRHGPSENIYLETGDEERARLPRYDGELLLRLHGTGCYSAKAVLKRWNGAVERLARVAEAACAAAALEGVAPPRARLARAWTALLAHQMHDDLTGTAIPAAYRLTLDDLGLAANLFEEALLGAVQPLGEALDASGTGAPYLWFAGGAGPALAEVALGSGAPPSAVRDARGRLRPVQVRHLEDGSGTALVPVESDGVEIQVLHLLDRAEPNGATTPAALEAAPDRLESPLYRASFDAAGRLASLVDKRRGRELLARPVILEQLPDRSSKYPAWEIRWEDVASPAREATEALVSRDVVERGPLRVALRIERPLGVSRVVETWSLASFGDDDWLECDVELDWRGRSTLLKQRFELSPGVEGAWFDTGLGAIRRPIASAALYEVPAQHWAAIEGGDGGVAIFADARHGWDHPAPGVLRLTWIHAPAAGRWKFRHQATQDHARHRFRIAIAGLAGGAIAAGEAAALADRFLERPRLFRLADRQAVGTESRPRRRSFLAVERPLRMLAWKPAEAGDGSVLRLRNPSSSPVEPQLRLGEGVELDRVVDAMEAPLASAPTRVPPAGVASRRLISRSAPRRKLDETHPVPLPWNLRGFSRQGESLGAGFDGRGTAFPLETVPYAELEGPVPFDLTHLGRGGADTWAPGGETLALAEEGVELWLLAASVAGGRRLVVEGCGHPLELDVPDWREPLLRESRWWRGAGGFGGWRLDPGTFRRRAIAFSSLHLHDRRGRDLVLVRGSLFAARIPLDGARRVRLDGDGAIRIVAATLAATSRRPWLDASPTPRP